MAKDLTFKYMSPKKKTNNTVKKPMRVPKVVSNGVDALATQERRSFTQTVNIMVESQVRMGVGKIDRKAYGNTILKTVDMPIPLAVAVENIASEAKVDFTSAVISMLEKELRKKDMFG